MPVGAKPRGGDAVPLTLNPTAVALTDAITVSPVAITTISNWGVGWTISRP